MNRYYRSFALVITIGIFVWVGYSACIKNKCVGVLCVNNGVCVDGICACPYGYEGADCNAEWVYKFTGSWNGESSYLNDASGSISSYYVRVQGSKDSFYVYGFMDTIPAIKCKISSRFEVTIPTQVLDSNFTINTGRATYDSNSMVVSGTINFRLRDTLYRTEELQQAGYNYKAYVPVKRDTTMTARFSWKR